MRFVVVKDGGKLVSTDVFTVFKMETLLVTMVSLSVSFHEKKRKRNEIFEKSVKGVCVSP